VVVRIKERRPFEGVCTPTALGVEVNVIDLPAETDFFFVGGYVDLDALETGDVIKVAEYVSIPKAELKLFASEIYSGVQNMPMLRVPTRKAKNGYRITLTQTAGVLRSFPFQFVQFITEVV